MEAIEGLKDPERFHRLVAQGAPAGVRYTRTAIREMWVRTLIDIEASMRA
jgi:hypothetical protein